MTDTTIHVKLNAAELKIIRAALHDRMQLPTSPQHSERLRKLAERLAYAQRTLQAWPIT